MKVDKVESVIIVILAVIDVECVPRHVDKRMDGADCSLCMLVVSASA